MSRCASVLPSSHCSEPAGSPARLCVGSPQVPGWHRGEINAFLGSSWLHKQWLLILFKVQYLMLCLNIHSETEQCVHVLVVRLIGDVAPSL